MKTNLIGLWPNLFRAIEIAKLGGYSISILFEESYENGFNDYKLIKSFCENWFDNFVGDGDIKVEIVKPYSYTLKYDYETLNDISLRIEKSLKHKKPEIHLCNSSEILLKTATERLNLSLSQNEKIKEIAATIAQTNFHNEIRVEHVAESIQLVGYLNDDSYINAESESIVFGDKIIIKLGAIDKYLIQSAINYLTKIG